MWSCGDHAFSLACAAAGWKHNGLQRAKGVVTILCLRHVWDRQLALHVRSGLAELDEPSAKAQCGV